MPRSTFKHTDLRASQNNGCILHVDLHARPLRKLGEGRERVSAVSWREAPHFHDAEKTISAST